MVFTVVGCMGRVAIVVGGVEADDALKGSLVWDWDDGYWEGIDIVADGAAGGV